MELILSEKLDGETGMTKKKYKGYLIARILNDELGKPKPYSFYPSKPHGRPPFLFKKKSTALKRLSSKLMEGYKFSNNLKVVKFKKSMYLDRY